MGISSKAALCCWDIIFVGYGMEQQDEWIDIWEYSIEMLSMENQLP